MKINGVGSSGKSSGVSSKKKTGAAKKSGKASAASSSGKASSSAEDSVELSSHEDTLEMIKGLVGESPDMRVDEVERIVGEIKQGKYKINFEKVAEGFIKDAIITEMSKRSPGKKNA